MDNKNKTPALPWYPKDFNADEHVIRMSLEVEGAYRRLLDHQWLHGSIPDDLTLLGLICKGVSKAKMRKIWAELAPRFPKSCDNSDEKLQESRRKNRKIERIRVAKEQYIEAQRESGRRGANKRWSREEQDNPPNNDGDPNGDPNSDPNGQPNGKPTKSLMADGWLAVASASASALTTTTTPAPIDAMPAWVRLQKHLPPTGPYGIQCVEFVTRYQNPAGMIAKLDNALQGIGVPGGRPLTPDELLAALSSALALHEGEGPPAPALLDGCFRNIAKQRHRRKPPAEGVDAPPTKPLKRLTDEEAA